MADKVKKVVTSELLNAYVAGQIKPYIDKGDSSASSDVAQERARAEAAESSFEDAMAAEIGDRKSADETLQSNIDGEASRARDAEKAIAEDLSAEESERKSADSSLQSSIDAEAQARSDADDDLGVRITFQTQRAESAIGSLRTTINDEISDREGADATLQSNLDAEIKRAADKETGLENSLSSGLANEKKAREDADSLLQSNLDDEAARAKSAEEKLAADLSSEASVRKSADETLQTNINAERTARFSADSSLQVNIDAETKQRKAADASNLTEAKTYTDAKTTLPRIKIEKSQLISETTASLTSEQYEIFTDANNDAVVVDLSAIDYPTLVFHKITEVFSFITPASFVAEIPQLSTSSSATATTVSNTTKLCITVNVSDSDGDNPTYYATISQIVYAMDAELGTEILIRKQNDEELQTNIDAETTRAKAAEKTLTDDLIPSIYGVSGTLTLKASDWSSGKCTATIEGLNDTDALIVSGSTFDDQKRIGEANLFASASSSTVTFTAETTPTEAISLNYFIARGK